MGISVILHPNLLEGSEEQISVTVSGATVGACLAAASATVPRWFWSCPTDKPCSATPASSHRRRVVPERLPDTFGPGD